MGTRKDARRRSDALHRREITDIAEQFQRESARIGLVVSGATFRAALDPLATGVPAELGLPEPTYRRAGRGGRWHYDVTAAQAVEDAHHLATMAVCFADSDEPETRAEGRACAKDRDRLLADLSRGGYTNATAKEK